MKFMTWNSSSIMSSVSYLSSALQRFDIDICGISEHWLYKKELHFLDSIHRLYIYAAVADFDLERPSKRKVGKGGVALLRKRSIDRQVTLLNIDDDRIIVVQYQIAENNFMYVIQVYLPSANHSIKEFESFILKLQDICSMYLDKGTLVVMGDFNAHINGQLFIKCHDRRSHIFNQFLSENKLSIANTLDLCTGTPSTFVFYCGQYISMIDHILVQNEKVDLVSVCQTLDDDALNVSTHRPIVMHLNLPHAEQFLSDVPCRRRVKWCKVNQEEIIKYRERLDT